MEDNIIIEDIEFREELYQKTIEENQFSELNIHGIGDDENADN